MSCPPLDLSVVIITLNEERHLPECLEQLPEGVELIVLDSGSTDRTCEIARQHGARVETRRFTNYAEQKNAALDLATRRWVLSLDADEVLDPTLRAAIVTACQDTASHVNGYYLRRRLVFLGRKMRFGKTNEKILRLFQRTTGRFEAAIHEGVVLTEPRTAQLPGCLWHDSYQDLTDYFQRFNNYTSRVAADRAQRGKRSSPMHVLRFWSDFLQRYVLHLGFLDGYAGYSYALLSSFYTFVKYAKLRELQHAGPRLQKGATPEVTRRVA